MKDINHTLFDQWSEQSAYIFGFWLADGNISLNKSPHGNTFTKRFSIYNTDLQVLSDIGKVIGLKPLSKKRRGTHQILYYIQANSWKLFDFCYSFTNTTNKSGNTLNLPEVPKESFHHFVRGFFDGDGSIHWKTYKTRHGKEIMSLQTAFSSGNATGSFLEQLRDRLMAFIPVGNKKVASGTSRKLSFNQYDSMLLCEWMYKDATIFMKRKKKIWDDADKEKLLNSKKYFSNKV